MTTRLERWAIGTIAKACNDAASKTGVPHGYADVSMYGNRMTFNVVPVISRDHHCANVSDRPETWMTPELAAKILAERTP